MNIKKEVVITLSEEKDFEIISKISHIFHAYGSAHETKIDGESHYGRYDLKEWAEISEFLHGIAR